MSDDQNQDELVSQFLAVTGIADVDRATSYLEMSGGVLDTAVALFLEHSGGNSSASAAAAGPSEGGFGGAGGDVRAPDATRTMRLMDSPMMGGGMGMPHPMMGLLQQQQQQEDMQDYAMMSSSAWTGGAATSSSSGGAAAAARDVVNQHAAALARAQQHDMDDEDDDEEDYEFIDDDDEAQEAAAAPTPNLQDMFAPPSHLIHSAGGFQGARSVAKDSRRWLLVNIQRDSEFSSHALNRDVWRDELVENLVREGFIFWQTFDVTPDGRTYAERYQVAAYPHVAILDPRTARLMWRKEGWTQQDPLTSMGFAEAAMDFCSRHSFDKPPVAARPGTSTISKKRPMTEQEQLQEAMRASLKRTESSSEDNNMEEEDDDEGVEYLGTTQTTTQGDAAALPEAKKEEEKAPGPLQEWLALPVGDEPADGARIQIRTPDAKRLVRKFSKAATVQTIYAFVAQSNEECQGGREFRLMAGFPPKDLLSDIDNTIESCGLAGQAITVRWKE